jgi:putative ABC transport system substrate-binding protein
MLSRRAVLRTIGLFALSTTVRAQPSKSPVIGFLSSRSPAESADVVAAFAQGLREGGFVEGRNVAIAFRWAEGRYERLPALAAELVGLPVSVVLAAGGPPAALAAKAATATIPIVFSGASDPVRLGLVANLNRPGGNVTGMSTFASTLGAKRLGLLRELVPRTTAIAYLVNPSNPNSEMEEKETQSAADALGIKLHVLKATTEEGIDAAFADAVKLRAGAMAVAGEAFFDSRRDRVVALAARHAVPAIYAWREYVVAGGLMSYGSSLADSYRRAGVYVGRILKGEIPADLPVLQPDRYELAINLKTAKALRLVVPQSLLVRADEVIR